MTNVVVASGIAQADHLTVFDKLAAARFAAVEVEKVLIYLIDKVDADALDILAAQFDILGYKGWKLATDEAKKRAILKKAIELHRYKGTVYAIRNALISFGYGGCEIQEHLGKVYDGSEVHDGIIDYATSNWATFRVFLDLGNSKGINDDAAAEVSALIEEYKNVRSHLVDLRYTANLDDSVTMTETFEFEMTFTRFDDSMVAGHTYNGAVTFDGTSTFNSGYREDMEVTEIP